MSTTAPFDVPISSSVSTGVAPITVLSTTMCPGLNVQYLGGQDSSFYTNFANFTGTISSGTWQGDIIGVAYGGTGLDGSAAANGSLLIGTGTGYSLATLTGTAARLSVTNGSGSITLDIDPTYVGQASITTLGTITTGVWNGTVVQNLYGGTGLDTSTAANGTLLIGNGTGFMLTTLTGTASRLSVTNGAGSITIDIDPAYVGQTSITTLGTITAGTWHGTIVENLYGGTGLDTSTTANGTLLIGNGAGFSLNTLIAGSGIVITVGAGTIQIDSPDAGGTVTSVALALPVSVFTVSGSPVTTAGTLTGTFTTQTANTVFAGPTTGSPATPVFRALVAADIPPLDTSKITTGIFPPVRGGTGIDGSAAANGTLLIGNGTGYSLSTLTGTANRLTVTNGAGSITLDISAAYFGQTSITTIGTVTTGTWQATIVENLYGGTGLDTSTAANGTLLIGNGTGFTLTTLTGTASRLSVVNGAGSIMLDIDTAYVGQTSITTLGTITTGTWHGTIVENLYGGTGLDTSTAANGTLLIGNSAGFTLATLTGTTNRLAVTNGAGSITLDVSAAYIGQTSITTLGTITTGTWNGTIVAPLYGGTGVNGSAAANGTLLIGNGTGYTLATLTGTASRLSVVNGAGSITLDISAAYVGQTSITTLGTITTGAWQASIIGNLYGGTGLDTSSAANGTLLIGNGSGFTLATLTGTASRLTVTNAAGSITLDISAAYVGQTSITTLGTITTGTWQGTIVAPLYGGTGVDGSSAANGTLLIGNGAGYTLTTLTGTSNRLTVTNGAGSITLDISAAYIGQASITTLGTITTGTWQGTIVAPLYGGTGVNGSSAANGTLLIGNGTGYTLATLTAGTGVSIGNAAGAITINNTGVTSVALALPASVFSVSGSPVTTTGTLTGAFTTQTANTVFAGPTAGGAATPTFRALVSADVPSSLGSTTVASLTVSDLTQPRVVYVGTAGKLVDDSGFTRVAGTSLTVDSGVDSTITLGTLKIGVPASGTAGSTYVGSVTNFTNVAYSLLFNTSGDTTVNAKTGRSIFHTINNATVMTQTATALGIASTVTTSTFNSNLASTSASTGAVVVVGGVGANNFVTATTVGYTLVAAPGSPADGDVWNDSTQKAFAFRNTGLTTFNVAAMFLQTSTVTISNTAVETTMFGTGIGTLTMPANFLTVGKTIRIRCSGSWIRAANANIQWRVRVGGVVIVDSTVEASNNTTGTPTFNVEATLTCRTVGVSGTMFGAQYIINVRDTTNSGNGNMYGSAATSSGTINTTTTLAINSTFTMSAASPANILTVYVATVEILG